MKVGGVLQILELGMMTYTLPKITVRFWTPKKMGDLEDDVLFQGDS